MKKLKSDSPIPLYYQLREIIRDKIMIGDMEQRYLQN
jgi:GntR family transcriptional regulator